MAKEKPVTVTKLNDLLSALDDAFEAAEARNAALATARAAEAQAVADAKTAFDLVKAQHAKIVGEAVNAADVARVRLEKAQEAVSLRVGTLTGGGDPRVSISR